MSRQLPLPSNLKELPYFVVRWNRESDTFDLLIPSWERSYPLGDAFAARAYLERAAGEYLGGRAHDAARSWGASQAIPAEQRAWGIDLTKDALGRFFGVAQAEERRQHDKLFGRNVDDEVLVV